MRRSLKTWIVWMFVVTGLLASSGCSDTGLTAVNLADETTTTAQVRRGDLRISLSGTGEIVFTQIPLAFAITGNISELALLPGDTVQAGQVIARLDNRQAELDLKSAQINLDKLSVPQEIASAQLSVLELEQALRDAQSSLVELQEGPQVWYYQSLLDQASAEYAEINQAYLQALALSQIDPKTYSSLVTKLERQEESTRQAVEDAQEDLNWAINYSPDNAVLMMAEAKVAMAEARLNSHVTYLDVLLGKSEPSDGGIGGWNDELVAFQRSLLAVQKAQWTMDQSILTAPVDGIITRVAVAVGERVAAGAEVLTLAALEKPLVRFYLEETDMAQLTNGDSLEIRLEAYPEQVYRGTIVRIDPTLVTVSGSPAIQVWGAFDLLPAQALLEGMSAEVEVIAAEAQDTLLIPLQALRRTQDGGYFVEVLQDDGTFVDTAVMIGLQDLANVQILSGLQLGDQVNTAVR